MRYYFKEVEDSDNYTTHLYSDLEKVDGDRYLMYSDSDVITEPNMFKFSSKFVDNIIQNGFVQNSTWTTYLITEEEYLMGQVK